jgi:hypothetical protein
VRENKPTIRYDREELIAVLREAGLGAHDLTTALDEYEAHRILGKDAACQSVVYHGPGHQSSTYCQAVGGRHDETEDGKVLHAARLPSGGFAEWTDDEPYDRNHW